MLTPRLPLYIPCVYNCFMYFGVTAAWKLRLTTPSARLFSLGRIAEAAAAGLLAELFYAPYDIVGAKFLWWTWHDTDAAIAERLLGVPIGSSIWVITFVAVFSMALRGVLGAA